MRADRSSAARVSPISSRLPSSDWLGRLPPEEERLPLVLVEAVEQGRGQWEQLLVVAPGREAADQDVEPRRLRRVVPLVLEICVVDDLRDLPQDRVGELVAAQEPLERARAAVMRELGGADVERRGVIRYVVRVVHEQEVGIVVEETADQP